MDFKNRYPGIDRYAAWLINKKARQLTGKYGFTQEDREDIEQELMLDLFNRLSKYNRDRSGRNTFIARIVENKVRAIIKNRKAGIRDCRVCVYSLSESIENGEGNTEEHLNNLDQNDYFLKTGRCTHPLEELGELSIDLRRAIDSLPPKLRNLFERLQEETISEISRSTCIPRGTIHGSIVKLRRLLEKAGLKKYF